MDNNNISVDETLEVSNLTLEYSNGEVEDLLEDSRFAVVITKEEDNFVVLSSEAVTDEDMVDLAYDLVTWAETKLMEKEDEERRKQEESEE